jgi:integrase
MIRFQVGGKRCEEALGWASEGWSEQKAFLEMAKLKEAAKTGEGPSSLAEKRAAVEAQRQAEEEAEAVRKAQEERDNLSFDRFFGDTYLPQQRADGKSARSLAREEEFARLWIGPLLGTKPLRQISPLDLERLKKRMTEAGRAARSVSYCLAVVRQVFNHAKRLGLYEGEPPTGKVKKPVEDNRRLRFLTVDEAAKLLAALAERSQNTHDIALVSLHCGLRAGEVFSLEWGDVDLERGVLTIRGTSRRAGTKTKSGKTRAAIMTEAVKDMLAGRERGEHHELVFPGRDGNKIVQISDTFNRTVKALGFNDGIEDDRQRVVFHTLRHTYASRLVECGVDLYTVKELMGHGMIQMTERYSHLSEDTLKNAVRIMESQLRPQATLESAGKTVDAIN